MTCWRVLVELSACFLITIWLVHAEVEADWAVNACTDAETCTAVTGLEGSLGFDEAGLLQMISPAQAKQALAPGQIAASHKLAYTDLPEAVQRAADTIRSSISQMEASAEHCNFVNCTFTAESDCPMSDMSPNTPWVIYPDANVWGTVCLDTSSPYQFQVSPGDTDKLLIYFQQGGFCGSAIAWTLRLCKTNAIPVTVAAGVWNKAAADNPYQNYTIVLVTYCSGDLHIGNTVQQFVPPAHQFGYKNARAAITWASQNVDLQLTNFVIMGSSSGGAALEVWSKTLLTEFTTGNRSSVTSRVILDSWVGLRTPFGTGANWANKFETCGTPLGSGWTKTCGEDLTRRDCLLQAMQEFPHVPFTHINSKGDLVQRGFYTLDFFGSTLSPCWLSDCKFYGRVLDVFAEFSKCSNWAAYLVDGCVHSFTDKGPCIPNIFGAAQSAMQTGHGPARSNVQTDQKLFCDGSMYDARPGGGLDRFRCRSGQVMFKWMGQSSGSITSKCRGFTSPRIPGLPFSPWFCDQALRNMSVPVR